MAENEGTEQTETPEAGGFHVELSENSDGRVFVDSEDEADEADATESSADSDATATAADAAEDDRPAPPTAEEMGLDPKNPVEKALFDKALKTWSKWTSRFDAKQKQQVAKEPEAPAPTPATEQAAAPVANGDDPFAPIFKVDFDSWKPVFREGSELADYGDELKDLMVQMAQHTLGSVHQNDFAFRTQQAENQVRARRESVVGPYIAAISSHPEFEAKFHEIREFAMATDALSLRDPERWLRLVEAEFGLSRDWGAPAAAPEQNDSRLANKPRAVVQRPTQTARPPLGAGQSAGTYRGEEGFEVAWQGRR